MTLSRRRFLRDAAAAGLVARLTAGAATRDPRGTGGLHLAAFRFDATPPPGHACCGGWIRPVEVIDDPLEGLGLVLLGAGPPIVLCTLDWTGLLNESHLAWRTALAAAAGTTPDRVTVHTVHQHNAPLVCAATQRLLDAQPDLPRSHDPAFVAGVLARAQEALRAALPSAEPVTHVAFASAPVLEVAANRRVARGTDGRVTAMRGSSCRDARLLALPEGEIDPLLRTIAYYSGSRKLAACHTYATHPMSYYGDGRVSADFCGLARRRVQTAEPECLHLYFTGCAGDVAAGRYNDGSPAARRRLTDRIQAALVAAGGALRPEPLSTCDWRTREVFAEPNPELAPAALRELLAPRRDAPVFRMRPAFKLAFLERCVRRQPLVLGALHLNGFAALHLPAEPFVAYQLAAPQLAGRPVAVAAYGDCGPWYLPTAGEHAGGGYEVEHAFATPGIDTTLREAMRGLLA
jgi:hypothetical protein